MGLVGLMGAVWGLYKWSRLPTLWGPVLVDAQFE